ncbi:two-component regulatory system response regulator EvgA [Enterobacterales bacterium]|nr:two-component regulatory system response regulator EvgA [Enterobacterales bacterium]
MSKKVLLVDDHPLILLGVNTFLTEQGYQIIAEASDGIEALLLADRLHPDIVILDIGIPKLNGIQVIYHLMAEDYPVNIIVFSSQELKHYIHACMQAGAAGYVRKNATLNTLLYAIESASLGHALFPHSALSGAESASLHPGTLSAKISPCERKVMGLLLQGKSNNDISRLLNRSPKTTSAQKKSLLKKLNVSSFAELLSLTAFESLKE